MANAEQTGNIDNTLNIMNLQLNGAGKEEQLIVFTVGDEEFGLNVLRVQEIIRYVKPTKIPHAPLLWRGVIDFRGDANSRYKYAERFGIRDADNKRDQCDYCY